MATFLEHAEELGRDAGHAAGTWAWDDGSSTTADYQSFLDGDAEIDPPAWLSGEWADSPTPATLADDLGIDPASDDLDAACQVYEDAALDAYMLEVNRHAAAMTS